MNMDWEKNYNIAVGHVNTAVDQLNKAKAKNKNLRTENASLKAEVERLKFVLNADENYVNEMLARDDLIAKLREGHCKDCCCARAWKALGITGYDGMDIPEHIIKLRENINTITISRDYWWSVAEECRKRNQRIKRIVNEDEE